MGAFKRAWDATRRASRIWGNPRLTGNESRSGASNLEINDGSAQLPSFFVIGPPRTGTGWIHEILREHTNLPRFIKETRFFDTHFQRGLGWYQAHYECPALNRPQGEVAPTYFASSLARERIASVIPWAKVVCVFRNPVERVLSLYRVKRAYGMIPWSFEQAMLRDPELMESSKYAQHLQAWQDALGVERVRASVFEDLRDEPQSFVDGLADFIGIPRFSLTPKQIRRIHGSDSMTEPRNYYRTHGATKVADWCKARRLDRVVAAVKGSPLSTLFLGGGAAFAQLPPEVSTRLYTLFRPEVEALEGILNRDLSHWKLSAECLETLKAIA